MHFVACISLDLRDLIEEENKDEEEQSGFRTGRSCTDNRTIMYRQQDGHVQTTGRSCRDNRTIIYRQQDDHVQTTSSA
jgi:hypothetical protein